MFFSVTFAALANSAPRSVLPWILPPVQSPEPIWVESQRPPVPLTVKLPAPVKPLTVMPLGAPLELIAVKLKAPVAVVIPTALPVVDDTPANEKLVAPLLRIVTASPLDVETLPKVTVDPLVAPLKLTPLPAAPLVTLMLPKAN